MSQKQFGKALMVITSVMLGLVIAVSCMRTGDEQSGITAPDNTRLAIHQEGVLPGTPPDEYMNAPSIPLLQETGEKRRRQEPNAADVMDIASWKILQETYRWVGVPYVYGGNSRTGIDCSHLVYQVYRNVGISYPYLTTSQIKTSSRFICVNPAGGDIIMFRNLNHCGIYIGNGWMIDANSYYGKVRYDYIWDSYWSSQGPYAVRFIG